VIFLSGHLLWERCANASCHAEGGGLWGGVSPSHQWRSGEGLNFLTFWVCFELACSGVHYGALLSVSYFCIRRAYTHFVYSKVWWHHANRMSCTLHWLVCWSLTSLFSTNTAISETSTLHRANLQWQWHIYDFARGCVANLGPSTASLSWIRTDSEIGMPADCHCPESNFQLFRLACIILYSGDGSL